VVLVVQERPDDLLLHAFFLVTNFSKFDWPSKKVLALYRKRGSAEAHTNQHSTCISPRPIAELPPSRYTPGASLFTLLLKGLPKLTALS
jgi:hypothetical protein